MTRIPEVAFEGTPDLVDADEARALDTALRTSGFAALRTPTLAPPALAPAFAAAARFFEAPAEVKARFAYRDTTTNFGYQGPGTEALDPSAPPDLKESFTMRDLTHRAADASLFPDADLRDAALALHARCTALARAVMRHLAHVLEVEGDYFVRLHSGANVTLRFLNYPGGLVAKTPAQLGAGAHTDYGSFTLLMQDGTPGLQVHGANDWIEVPGDSDRVVFNVGDLMQRWSNDRWPSTLHRVRAGTAKRLSIAFFVDPDDDAPVACLPSCTRDRPAAYAPTTAGAHILSKLNASQPSDTRRQGA